jgi:molybdate transport system permease protein
MTDPISLSLQTASVATLLSGLLGVLLARWRLDLRGRRGVLVDTVILLPLALPPTVVGFGLLVALGRYSPVGAALESVGMSILFTWPATVVASFVASLPLMYQCTLAAFRQIDHDLIDVARLAGLSEGQILRHVLIALAAPGVAAGVILAFIRALGEFGATLMIAGNIPGRTQTMPLAIYFAVESGRWHSALVLSGVTVVLALAAVVAVQRFAVMR